MKRVLPFLLAMLIYIPAFSQTDSTKKDTSQTPTLDKVEHLVDKYSAKIADVFIASMDKATPVAKEGFKSLVWFQVAVGIADLVPLLLFFIFWRFAVVEYNRIDGLLTSDKVPEHMNDNYGPMGDSNITPKLIAYLILTFLSAIVALFATRSGVLHLLAPKWYAIKEIIDLVK